MFCFLPDFVVTDLSMLLNKLNEGFIALAAQLQVTHETVKVTSWEMAVVTSITSSCYCDCRSLIVVGESVQ